MQLTTATIVPKAGASSLRLYTGAIGIVIVTVGLAFIAHKLMPHASLSLLFLTGVLIISVRTGLGPSLLASVLSFLAYNFFFTPPYYTFEVANDGDVATLVFFLIMAAITGNLAARMRQEMEKRRTSLQRTSILYEFIRRISSSAGTDSVVAALADHLSQSMDKSVMVLMVNNEGIPVTKTSAGRLQIGCRHCRRCLGPEITRPDYHRAVELPQACHQSEGDGDGGYIRSNRYRPN